MNAFIVTLDNEPGAAAEVAEAIAERGINVTGGSGATCGDSGTLVVTTNDEAGTRRVLEANDWKFREVELVPATLSDAPGTLADALRRLANANINVEAMIPMGMSDRGITIAFATNNASKTRSALGQLVTSSTR